LAAKKVIDHVMANVAQVVPPGEIYVGVGYHREAVRKHLGASYLYETQAESRGSWVLLRFSGTEPVLRIFSEAKTPEKACGLVDWLAQCA
jgi:phosphomannomutase